MRDRRDADDLQTTHANVREALEAAIASHPAATPMTRRRPPATEIPRRDGRASESRLRRAADDRVVVPLRAKVVALDSRRAGDEPDGPSAA
jgi:phage I-like protein